MSDLPELLDLHAAAAELTKRGPKLRKITARTLQEAVRTGKLDASKIGL